MCIRDSLSRELQSLGVGAVRLIVAMDLTKGNKTQGSQSFHGAPPLLTGRPLAVQPGCRSPEDYVAAGQSLHALDPETNPYKMVLEMLGGAIVQFDPFPSMFLYGFGDFIAQGKGLVNFAGEQGAFNSVADAVAAYNTVLRKAHLSSPINWAPAIYQAINSVQSSGGRFHTLAILTSGPVRCPCCHVRVSSQHPCGVALTMVGRAGGRAVRASND